MVRRSVLAKCGVVLGLLAFLGLGGCYAMSQGLGRVGGCSPQQTGSPVCSYARSWSRAAQHQQEFIDQYFLLYDVNDPYRCNCPIYDYCPCGPCGQASAPCAATCRTCP